MVLQVRAVLIQHLGWSFPCLIFVFITVNNSGLSRQLHVKLFHCSLHPDSVAFKGLQVCFCTSVHTSTSVAGLGLQASDFLAGGEGSVSLEGVLGCTCCPHLQPCRAEPLPVPSTGSRVGGRCKLGGVPGGVSQVWGTPQVAFGK